MTVRMYASQKSRKTGKIGTHPKALMYPKVQKRRPEQPRATDHALAPPSGKSGAARGFSIGMSSDELTRFSTSISVETGSAMICRDVKVFHGN